MERRRARFFGRGTHGRSFLHGLGRPGPVCGAAWQEIGVVFSQTARARHGDGIHIATGSTAGHPAQPQTHGLIPTKHYQRLRINLKAEEKASSFEIQGIHSAINGTSVKYFFIKRHLNKSFPSG